MNQVEQALVDANAIVAQVEPLVGIAGIAVRGIIALLKKNGQEGEAKAFQDEYDASQAARAELRAAIDAFKAKYPVEPVAPTEI